MGTGSVHAMTSSTARTGVALALAFLVVGLILATAVHLGHQHDAAAAAVEDCGPVSGGDQLALLWLAQIRQDDGIALTNISLGDCVSGVRGGVTALVEVGRSEAVEKFFTDRYHCEVQRSCSVTTKATEFLVNLDFATESGWALTVHPI